MTLDEVKPELMHTQKDKSYDRIYASGIEERIEAYAYRLAGRIYPCNFETSVL
ncbi:MAG: hypothetical protein NC419_05990 [Muribaculaceae bacterium]|nr:hypothetical protein [Muribaculaceae bacterium]